MIPVSNQAKLYFLLSACLIHFSSQAQSKKDSTWIMTGDGCKVYNPHPVKNETIAWTGKCIGGYAAGEGVLTWFKNGDRSQEYTGYMERGVPHGYGKYDYLNGRTYEGQHVKGDRVGMGRIVDRDKKNIVFYSYDGEFKNDRPEGVGLEIYYYSAQGDTSSVYKGNFLHGARNGPGLLKDYTYDRIDIYKGTFIENEVEGETEIWEYKKGKQVLYYKGSIHEKYKDGYGEEIIGCNRYSGQWKKSEKEGRGKLIADTIVVYDGEWKSSEFDGIGKRFYPDGSYYVGEFKKNERDGFGVLRWKDGFRYVGEFKKDLFAGKGYILKAKTIYSSGIWDRGTLKAGENLRFVRQALETKYKDQFQQFDANSD
jgi:hypothetical protein